MTTPAADSSIAAWPPELRLAVACCTPRAERRQVAQLAEAVDWDRFLPVVDRHRVSGLAARALAEVEMPAEARAALTDRAQVNLAANLRAGSASAELSRRLDMANVPHLFVKGLTLSAVAYGDPFLKVSADVDVLVSPEQIPAAAEVLAALRFRLTEPGGLPLGRLARWHRRHKESGWYRSTDATLIDLHSRLADSDALLAVRADTANSMVAITPSIDLPTLARGILPTYLAVHGASSGWFRLKWIADFAAVTVDEDPATLLAKAQTLGARRAMVQALLLCNRLFGFRLPPRIENRHLSSRLDGWLLALAKSALRGGEPTERPFGTIAIHANQLLMNAQPVRMIGEAVRQLQAAVDARRWR